MKDILKIVTGEKTVYWMSDTIDFFNDVIGVL